MIKGKKARAEYIDRRARELAESGKYQDWLSIEMALRHEGFLEARQLLDSHFLRQELNDMCKSARKTTKGG